MRYDNLINEVLEKLLEQENVILASLVSEVDKR